MPINYPRMHAPCARKFKSKTTPGMHACPAPAPFFTAVFVGLLNGLFVGLLTTGALFACSDPADRAAPEDPHEHGQPRREAGAERHHDPRAGPSAGAPSHVGSAEAQVAIHPASAAGRGCRRRGQPDHEGGVGGGEPDAVAEGGEPSYGLVIDERVRGMWNARRLCVSVRERERERAW